MIRYYWGRFWPFLLFAFGIEVVENLFTVFFEYRNMDFGFLPLLKTGYVFVTECAIRIDKQQKECYNNAVIDNDVII